MTYGWGQVKPELTGWRDERISARHREWGFNCPAVDIDFMVIEYDMKKVMALVDYKHEAKPWPVNLKEANYEALRDLADRTCSCGGCTCKSRYRVPAFVCRYEGADLRWFEPEAINDIGRVWVPERQRLSEREWVVLLYRMRTRRVPDAILRKLAA